MGVWHATRAYGDRFAAVHTTAPAATSAPGVRQAVLPDDREVLGAAPGSGNGFFWWQR